MNDVLSRLRAATGEAHERLERRLNILEQIATFPARRELVARFHGLHAGAEAVLAPWLADLPDLDFDGRRRSRQLAADLAALGGAAPPACPAPPPRSRAEALGILYVLEGSTLGAKVIRRAVVANGQDMSGLSFLDPYGAQSGARWRSFLAILAREAPSDDEPAMAAAASGGVLGFRCAEAWLCAQEAVA